MHPSVYSRLQSDKPAYIIDGDLETVVTYGELEATSNQAAHLFRSIGLERGDCVAIMMANVPHYFSLSWGAQRSGLYFVCISTKLQLAEVAHILEDSAAGALFVSEGAMTSTTDLRSRFPDMRLFGVGMSGSDIMDIDAALAQQPKEPIADESAGIDMLYSSGTTGLPKGIRRPLPTGQIAKPTGLSEFAHEKFGVDQTTVYLSPAPLYHSAPLRWSMAIQQHGGTVIVMPRFDAERALTLIERHRVTHAQFVPTHFVRLLRLPNEIRKHHDIGSLRAVIHAAAPCAIPIKEQMIDWFGPIIHEYYAGTEGNGLTTLDTEEWLAHPGSVGKPVDCRIFICNEEGEPLPAGSEGQIYFADGPKFAYHNDPQKTQASYNRHGWSTIGDIGRVDDDGYLYLTDRKGFMIISGGVNIYPQEVENLLITHPKVADVAVLGIPDEDMGERVLAIVQPEQWIDRGDELGNELIGFVRTELSHVKAPRQVEFRRELPRHPTGKLYKRLLKDEYWSKGRAKTVTRGA